MVIVGEGGILGKGFGGEGLKMMEEIYVKLVGAELKRNGNAYDPT